MRYLLAFLAFYSSVSFSAVTRTVEADVISSSDHTKTFTTAQIPVAANTVSEVPGGAVNGTNTTFVVSAAPGNGASLILQLDGIFLEQGTGKDYTFSGTTITMLTPPALGQSLVAIYAKY